MVDGVALAVDRGGTWAHDLRVKLFKSAEEKQQVAEAEQSFRDVIAGLATSDPEQAKRLSARLTDQGLMGLGSGNAANLESKRSFNMPRTPLLTTT